MATKNYMINDKWLDINKKNIIELQSVDGVLDSMKVNGSEIVTPSGKITITENGTDIDVAQYALADVNVEGGSSDFSTAEVTLVNSANTNLAVMLPVLYEADPPFDPNAFVRGALSLLANETFVLNVPLYKGHCLIKKGVSGDRIDGQTVATTYTVTSGSATSSMEGVDITGDCTITIS